MNRTDRTRRAAFALPLLCALTAVPALLPAPAFAATSGSGKSATENRTVGDFQAVSTNGSIDLIVRQGAQTAVQVTADDNLLPLLETVVEPGKDGNGVLKVGWKRGENIWHRGRVTVNVTLPKLASLATAGSGDIQVEAFQTPSLSVAVAGAGNAQLKGLATEELGIRISGSGNVGGQGKATKVKVSIAGSGDVKLMDMSADDVSVSIAGSGDAAVNAGKTLSVSIAGSGDVVYSGDAQVKSSVAGSGSVKKR